MGKIVGMIPARYDSKRFPGKMLADIQGKTLIQRSYENAAASGCFDEVVVVTDDPRIQRHVERFGPVVMTKEKHSCGSDRLAEAAREVEADIIVNLQGDWPNLEKHVIRAVIDVLGRDGVMGSAVIVLKNEASIQNPSIVKATMDRHGRALYFSRSPIPSSGPAFGHLGIYSFRRDFLFTFAKLSPTPLQQSENLEQLKALEHGYPIKLAVVETQLRSVDHPEDIEVALG